MKTIIISFCLLIGTFAASAQQSRWSVDVSGGVALPVGKFGGKHLTDSTDAFAKLGPVLSLTGSYKITRYFGVTALVSVQRNATDNKAITNALQTANPSYAFAVDEQAWKLGRVLGGAYLRYPLDRKKRLDVRLNGLAGVMKVDFPDRKLAESQSYGNGGFLETADLSYKVKKLQFAYQAGAEFRYALMRRFYLKAEADYAGAMIHVPYEAFVFESRANPGTPPLVFSTGTGTPITPTHVQTHYSQPLATVNVCLGVGVRF